MTRKVWEHTLDYKQGSPESGDSLQGAVKGRERRRDVRKGNDRQKGKKGGVRVSKAKYYVISDTHMQKVHPQR